MNKINPKVDAFINSAKQWQKEFEILRKIALECKLTEEFKWGKPCYTFPTESSGQAFQNDNIVLIHDFKEYCAYLFFKGALMKDAKRILIQQTENVQAARQVRFTGVSEIVKMKSVLKAYINEAVKIEKAGLKVEMKKTSEFKIPEEFQNKLNENPELKTAFESLTPGRQRGYILYFSQAKQSKTRESRIEKYVKQILKGKGLDD